MRGSEIAMGSASFCMLIRVKRWVREAQGRLARPKLK
jgi:hypothetical protein